MSIVKDSKTARTRVLGETGLNRIAAIAGLLVLALALQTTVLTRATLLGVIPGLLLVVVVSLAFTDGERVGTAAGFFGGLLLDLGLKDPVAIMGLTALIYTLIGFVVGSAQKYSTSDSVWMPVVVVAGASAVAEFSYATFSIMFGQQWVSLAFTAKAAGLVILYNTLLTPFVYPLVRKVADRFRPERVHRW